MLVLKYDKLIQITLQVVISQARRNDLIQKNRRSRSLRRCKLLVQSAPNLESILRVLIASNRSCGTISDLRQLVSQLSRERRQLIDR